MKFTRTRVISLSTPKVSVSSHLMSTFHLQFKSKTPLVTVRMCTLTLKFWAKSADIATYQAAIDAAQGVATEVEAVDTTVSGYDATEDIAKVTTATSTLAGATTTFEAAKTEVEAAETLESVLATLNQAITDAKADLDAVVSSEDGDNFLNMAARARDKIPVFQFLSQPSSTLEVM